MEETLACQWNFRTVKVGTNAPSEASTLVSSARRLKTTIFGKFHLSSQIHRKTTHQAIQYKSRDENQKSTLITPT